MLIAQIQRYKLQNGNMKDESTLKEVITTLSEMTGRQVSKEQEEKIINAVIRNPAIISHHFRFIPVPLPEIMVSL